MDIRLLRVSLTKHGAYKVAALLRRYPVDEVLSHCRDRALGIDIDLAQAQRNLSTRQDEKVPDYWHDIKATNDERLLNSCVFVSIIFSHYELISTMIRSTTRNCIGRVTRGQVIDGKAYTNFADIIRKLGFAETPEHIPQYIDFNFSHVLSSSNYSGYIRQIISQKLTEAGLTEQSELISICVEHHINRVFGLSATEFAVWITSGVHAQSRDDFRISEELQDSQHEMELTHETGEFLFMEGHNEKREEARQVVGSSEPRVLTFLHSRIQNQLCKQLAAIHGHANVGSEQNAGYGNKVDVVLKEAGGYTFFEIKTDPSLRLCVRHALAQLIEYSYFPNRRQANHLVIVSQHKLTKSMTRYMQHLRETLRLPVVYLCYDPATSKFVPDLQAGL